jgi:hypothetical protein
MTKVKNLKYGNRYFSDNHKYFKNKPIHAFLE